jgi:hypothetical protein
MAGSCQNGSSWTGLIWFKVGAVGGRLRISEIRNDLVLTLDFQVFHVVTPAEMSDISLSR